MSGGRERLVASGEAREVALTNCARSSEGGTRTSSSTPFDQGLHLKGRSSRATSRRQVSQSLNASDLYELSAETSSHTFERAAGKVLSDSEGITPTDASPIHNNDSSNNGGSVAA